MAAKVDIYNMALVHVGAATITSVDDAVKGTTILNVFYESVRDRVISMFPWSFAIAQATLVQLASAPTYGYADAYQLPSGCLSVLGTNQDIDYRITSGGVLECDFDDVEIGESLCLEYIKQITDESLFPSAFVKLLALDLALEVADSFGVSANRIAVINEKLIAAHEEAKIADVQQDKEDSELFNDENADSWVALRT